MPLGDSDGGGGGRGSGGELEVAVAALVGVTRLLGWMWAPHQLRLSDHVLQAGVGAAALALAITGARRRRAYARIRLVAIPAIRLGTLLISSLIGSDRTATAALLLGREPAAGAAGAARDTLRLLLGSRLLQSAMATLVFPLPLPLAAATHAAVVALNRDTRAMCATRFLAAPLSQQRLECVAAVLDRCTLVASPVGAALPLISAGRGAGASCAAVLTFLQLAFTVLPLVVLAWRSAGRRAAAAAGLPSGKLQRAAAAADATLRAALLGDSGWGARAALSLWVLTLMWLLAR